MQIQISEAPNLLIVVCRGAFDADTVIATMREHIPRLGQPDALWDFSDSDLSTMSPDDFGRISQAGMELADLNSPVPPRTAMITGGTYEAMVLKAFIAKAESQNPVLFAIFPDRESAMNWLRPDGTGT